MESTKCPICKSQNTSEWYSADIDISKLTFTYEFSPESQKTFRVVRCHNCTHAFCFPLPKNIYKNYEDVVDQKYLHHSKSRKLSAQAVLSIIRPYAQNGMLLDVGCATGDFLAVARDLGYHAEGLELSRWSSKITRKKGIKVYQDRLKSLARQFPAKYDIITLWGVIEHFENPADEMRYINRLLKPSGLLVLWTGDVNGVMSRLLGRRWWYWQGQHVQYFTHKSLNYLAKLSGLEYIATKIYPIAAIYEQIDNSLSRYKFKQYIMWMIRLMFTIKSVWFVRLPGEMLWLARKKAERPQYPINNECK
ncbi:MAG: hypothetical protein A2698_01945 [Candidatus Levybacteria bacterium RIFCSPHIGHO2_01_FULL_42_15]|nr:MAG: hypothetical protein A2698_01945 [Candidatus Levybacteria bacterium RIFCSPHIGHO2_01_FULL_42_15]OGH41998.1 MAG: hypothetical protein A3B53_00625 [Candidatus Levybacteria bacterium RIFCSPLOWO2_01_FULL_42_15]